MAKSIKYFLSLALVALLVLQMPAGIWLKLAPIPDTIKINRLDGTLWQGTIQQIGLKEGLVSENVTWKWEPAALRQAALAWRITTDNGNQMLLELHRAGWQVAILQGAWPIQPFSQLHPQLKGLGISGVVQLNQQTINQHTSTITITLAEVRSRLSGNMMLGTYSLSLQPSTGQMTLSTINGALNLSGQGQLHSTGHGTLTINAQSSAPDLISLLENLGPATNDNKKSITMQF